VGRRDGTVTGNGNVEEGELEGHEEELFPRRIGDGEFDFWILSARVMLNL
jgi:hypothetical protein